MQVHQDIFLELPERNLEFETFLWIVEDTFVWISVFHFLWCVMVLPKAENSMEKQNKIRKRNFHDNSAKIIKLRDAFSNCQCHPLVFTSWQIAGVFHFFFDLIISDSLMRESEIQANVSSTIDKKVSNTRFLSRNSQKISWCTCISTFLIKRNVFIFKVSSVSVCEKKKLFSKDGNQPCKNYWIIVQKLWKMEHFENVSPFFSSQNVLLNLLFMYYFPLC